MVRKEMLMVSLMTGGYPINGKPKGREPEMHPEIWKRYALFAIVILLAGTVAYFAFANQTPVKTSGGMMGGGDVQQSAENAVNAATMASSFEAYKAEYARVRGMGDADIKNPYALIPIENIGKRESPLAYAKDVSNSITTASITNIEIGKDKITIAVEDGKNPQGQKFQQGTVLTLVLLTKDYRAARISIVPMSFIKPSEAVIGKDVYVFQGATNIGKSVEELIPKIQYIVIDYKTQ